MFIDIKSYFEVYLGYILSLYYRSLQGYTTVILYIKDITLGIYYTLQGFLYYLIITRIFTTVDLNFNIYCKYLKPYLLFTTVVLTYLYLIT